MFFSDKLQILRKQVNLTQDEFALQIGVSRQAISKWESGTAYPDLKNLQTLCTFFSVTPNTLLNPKTEDLTPSAQSTAFDISSLGENLRRLRASRSIAQESFAEMMGVSRQSVSNWEKGTALPKTELLIAMLDVLETDFDQLLPPAPMPESETEEPRAEEVSVVETVVPEVLPTKKKMKTRTKLLLALLPASLLLIALLVIGVSLTMPFRSADPFGEAVKTVFFDPCALEATSDSWMREGVVITLGSGTNALPLEIVTDADSVSIKGLSVQEDTIIRLPRKNIKAALAASKLAPSSHSSVSLSQEDYDVLEELLCVFESIGSDQPLDRTLTVLCENLEAEIATVVSPKTKYSLAKGELAMTKTVTYTLDRETLLALLDALERVATTPEAKALEFLLVDESNGVSEPTFEKLVKQTKRDIHAKQEASFVLSYSITKGKLDGIFIETSMTSKDKSVTKSALSVVCLLGETEEIGLDVTHFSSMEEDGATIEEKTFYTYRKKLLGTVLDLTLMSETQSTYKEGAGSQTLTETGNRQLIYDLGTGKYWYIEKEPELEIETRCEGTFLHNVDAKSLTFSFDRITVNGETLLQFDQLCVSVAARGTAPMQGNVKDLLTLSERNLMTVYRELPAKKINALFRAITNESLDFVYSKEGLLVSPALVERAEEYKQLYLEYLQSGTEESTQIAPKKIYIYDEIDDAYVLLQGDQHYVSASYAYELTEQLTQSHHASRILSNGRLEVHQMKLTGSIPATCTGYGEETYQCAICGEEYTVAITPLLHDWVEKQVSVRTDDNVDRTAKFEQCNSCKVVWTIKIENFCTVLLDKATATTYKVTDYLTSYDANPAMISIPEALLEIIPITSWDASTGVSRTVIRIPSGVSSVKKETFTYLSTLQTLVLPSSLTYIANGAFADTPKLHTIYYCGTEEQWKRVRLNQYATDWADVNVVFCPDGVTPEMIMDSLE